MTTPPINWDIDDQKMKLLQSAMAPHETAGVLRMYRAGIPGGEIMKMLNIRGGLKLMRQMQRALDEEGEAFSRSRPIHDATIKEES